MPRYNRVEFDLSAAAGRETSVFLPTNSRRLAIMILGPERGRFTIGDLHDLDLFVGDFVLCDRIGVDSTFEYFVCPEIARITGDPSAPLWDVTRQLGTPLRAYFRRDFDRYIHNRIKNGPNWPINTINQIEDDYMRDRFGVGFEEIGRPIVGIDNLYHEVEPNFIGPRTHFAMPNKEIFTNVLAEWTRKQGVNVSAGLGVRDAFLRDTLLSPVKRLYDITQDVHLEQLALLEKWTQQKQTQTSPLLTIVLDEASSRNDLLAAMIHVRSRFARLREEMKELNKTLRGDGPTKEKIDRMLSLEAARETILRKAIKNSPESHIAWTWDIVRKASLVPMFIEFGSKLLQWDRNRVLVGSARHFVDMEKLALKAQNVRQKITSLFGELAPTTHVEAMRDDFVGRNSRGRTFQEEEQEQQQEWKELRKVYRAEDLWRLRGRC